KSSRLETEEARLWPPHQPHCLRPMFQRIPCCAIAPASAASPRHLGGCQEQFSRQNLFLAPSTPPWHPRLPPGVTDATGRTGTLPNQIRPGKRILSSMCPTIVARDGKALLVIGSPGGRTIINTVFP